MNPEQTPVPSDQQPTLPAEQPFGATPAPTFGELQQPVTTEPQPQPTATEPQPFGEPQDKPSATTEQTQQIFGSEPSPFPAFGEPIAPVAAGAPGMQAPSIVADEGKTLGIVGFVLSLLGFGLVSLIVSILARIKSKKSGHSNILALFGIIISVLTMILGTIVIIIMMVAASKAVEYCKEHGTTTRGANGQTSYDCSTSSTSSSADTTAPVDESVQTESSATTP